MTYFCYALCGFSLSMAAAVAVAGSLSLGWAASVALIVFCAAFIGAWLESWLDQ